MWIICSILLFYLATKGVFYLGMNAGIFWLLSIYRFCYKYARSEIKGINERNESFANEIIKSLKNNQNTNDLTVLTSADGVNGNLRIINYADDSGKVNKIAFADTLTASGDITITNQEAVIDVNNNSRVNPKVIQKKSKLKEKLKKN